MCCWVGRQSTRTDRATEEPLNVPVALPRVPEPPRVSGADPKADPRSADVGLAAYDVS